MASYYTQLDDDRGAEGEVSEFEREQDLSRLEERHALARNSSVGATIECPVCSHKFKKTSYQQVFCSNQYKKRNGRNCKDKYNNIVNPRGIYAEVERLRALLAQEAA